MLEVNKTVFFLSFFFTLPANEQCIIVNFPVSQTQDREKLFFRYCSFSKQSLYSRPQLLPSLRFVKFLNQKYKSIFRSLSLGILIPLLAFSVNLLNWKLVSELTENDDGQLPSE